MKLNIKGDEMWFYGYKVKMKQLFSQGKSKSS